MRTDNKSEQPWYRTTLRWGQTNLTEIDPEQCDLEFWKTQWKATHVQGVIVNCGGIVAYYPSRFGLQYRAGTLHGRDYFGEFSKAAREAGLKVIARMDISRATQEFYDAHPDWFCVDRQGTPIMSQGRYFSCVNSGYYKEYIPSVLTEIIEIYSPEGFADNSWKGLGRNVICYCDNCKRKFMQECGRELPERVSWDDPSYREWIRWSYRCRTENWDLFNKTAKRVGGEDCLWVGMLHADPTNLAGGFGDLYALCSRSEIIFCDHQSRDRLNGFEENSLNGSLLRFASDEDIRVPESMANYVRGERSFRLAANPAEETRLWMFTGISGGISPWFHHIGGGTEDRRQFDTPIPVFDWHVRNEKHLYDRKDLAGVGLVWNQANSDFHGRDDVREKVTLPWRGICKALTRARIPFIPVNAEDIGKYADRLSTLVLSDVAVLSDAQIDAVCAFAESGGHLVVTGRTATLDQDGLLSDNRKLWDLLGLEPTGLLTGATGPIGKGWEYYDAHSYIRLPAKRHDILTGYENTDILAFGGGLHRVESRGPLAPIASYIPPFPIYPPEFSWIHEEKPDSKVLYAGTLDSGSRVVYFAADIDRCFGRSGLPDHGRLLGNAVEWATGGDNPMRVEGPGVLDCKAYKKEDRLILHLVNLSGADTSGYFDGFLPVGPFTIHVKNQGSFPSKAYLAVSDKEIDMRMVGDRIVLNIEQIVDHEMVILE